MDETGLIQTQEGVFRIGYSESTRTSFVFFGYHPEDLATNGAPGDLTFRHPERLYLIRAYKSLGAPHEIDGKTKINLSWLHGDLSNFLKDFPTKLFHEAVLHQLTATGSANVHEGYNVTRRKDGKVEVELTTKAHAHNLLAHVPDRVFGGSDAGAPDGAAKLQSLPTRLRKLLKIAPPSIKLRIGKINGNGEHLLESFDPDGLGDLILYDFAARLDSILLGFPPMSLKESPRLWLHRTGASFCASLAHLTNEAKENPDHLLRELGLLAAQIFLHSGHSALMDNLLENAAHVGQRENLKIIMTQAKKDWHALIAPHERLLGPKATRFRSELHECMAHLDVTKMRDIRPLDPSRHHVIVSLQNPPKIESQNDEVDFKLWLARRFLAPRNSTLRYHAANGTLYDIRDKTAAEIDANVKVVRLKAASGLVLHYVRATRALYAHYHKPSCDGPARLPSNAPAYFREGEILKLTLAPETDPATTPLEKRSYEAGCAEIRAASQIASIPTAMKPEELACVGCEAVPSQPAPKSARQEGLALALSKNELV